MKQNRIYYAASVCALAGLLALGARRQDGQSDNAQDVMAMQETAETAISPLYAGVTAEFYNNGLAEIIQNEDMLVASASSLISRETKIYSFLQGPKSWGKGLAWSGEWSNEYVKGRYFGNFGCGLCCMANIYSTLTDYSCSPWDMYEYAKQVSAYSPTSKVGAIGWNDMKTTLKKSGFDSTLCNKPDSYEMFQRQIAQTKGAVVLVCSRNDDTFWESTGGHYVNIWLYDQETDEVFLSDPGSPTRNRNRIPLRYVYDALKTSSQYQYLLINSYSEEENLWKQNGIDEAWVAPQDLNGK